ncbi:MAG: hypothetical protein HY555_05810 [Euryarchaeota archaeon]|nr:hypothetical protein [Euryarchaeota archaeon]
MKEALSKALRNGIISSAGLFLFLDKLVLHKALRLHSILFSEGFESLLLVIGAALFFYGIYNQRSLRDDAFINGFLLGLGLFTLFDVIIVDGILVLHAHAYPDWVEVIRGLGGLVLAGIGSYRTLSRTVR